MDEMIKAEYLRATSGLANIWRKRGRNSVNKRVEETPSKNEPFKKLETCCLEFTCTRCCQMFDEKKAPRNLQCGHILCTPCAKQCLEDRLKCPECGERPSVRDVSDLTINYPLLRYLRSSPSLRVVINVPKTCYEDPGVRPDQDSWKCATHGNPLAYLCFTCSAWACVECLVIDHAFHPRGKCRVQGVEKAMAGIRNQYMRMSSSILKSLDNAMHIGDGQNCIENFCHKHCPSDKRSHMRLFKYLKVLKEDFKNDIDKLEAIILQIRKARDKVNVVALPKEMTACTEELLEYQNKAKEAILQATESFSRIQDSRLEHLRMDLKTFVDSNLPIYAVSSDEEGGTSWAKFDVKDNRLLMYSLTKGTPPDGVHIPVEYVKQLVPPTQRIVFLELGTEEAVTGRVYIQLLKDSSSTRRKVMLFTGEGGASYRDYYFNKYDVNQGALRICQNTDRPGDHLVVQGLSEEPGEHWSYDALPGAFVADQNSSEIRFYLYPTSTLVSGVTGKVVLGLPLLKDASKLDPLTSTVIRDCGIFIPMRVN